MLEICELESFLSPFEKEYDAIRLIDPINKKSLNYSRGSLDPTGFECYKYWNRDTACVNCISMRAQIEDQVIIKLECLNASIIMVTAMPVKFNGNNYVVELLKNVTKCLYAEGSDSLLGIGLKEFVSKLNNSAISDSLTGLFNRRFIDERLPSDILNNTAEESHLSTIMVDIDDFKFINDTYGHIAGDFVLREITKAIMSCTRNEKDWVARYGGDEFLICLGNTDHETAVKVIERMKKNIEDMEIYFDGAKIKTTASFGFHTIFHDEITVDSFIDYADKNLYHAKKHSRNRI